MSVSSDYEPLEVIGRGSYGIVRKVRYKDGSYHVRKEIEYNSMNTQERNQLISELRILRELNHPNIVKYHSHDHLSEKKVIHIYMEYCDGGDLASVITNFKKNKDHVPEEFVWQVLIQTLLALHRCHYGIESPKVNLFTPSDDNDHDIHRQSEPKINLETVIIHRDIKPDNIFMMDNTESQIKVGDFGLAKRLTSMNDFAKTYVGTPYYMSPEVLMDEPYSPVCDIWSLGCVLYELCTLQPPFQAKTHLQLQQKIKIGTYKPISSQHYSIHLRSIIDDCITVNPEERPSCFDLLDRLPIKFLRKEMELKERQSYLGEFQKQLLTKNDELKKKEVFLNNLERKVFQQRGDLELEHQAMIKKVQIQRKKFEDEVMDEFEIRKRAMDQEAKEVRLGYQREFKLVVEQEVQIRLQEIIDKVKAGHQQYQQDHHGVQQLQQQLLSQLNIQQQHVVEMQRRDSRESSSSHMSDSKSQVLQQQQMAFKARGGGPGGPKELERVPLKLRNNDYDEQPIMKHTPSPTPQALSRNQAPGSRTRITDELERNNNNEKRHIPEYEELYLRQNYRH